MGGWVGRGAAGGRPRHMRAWARRYRQAYRVLPAAPHATDGARPTQPAKSVPRYGGAIRPPRPGPGGTPRAWPDHAGAEGPPNASFSSAAGSRDRPRHATARNGIVKNAQVWGRASGVCCERGWAAGLAAGRRVGAHHNWRAWARRYRQAYRVLPAAPHATDGARPTQPSTSVPRYGGAIRPTLRRWWRSTRMPGSVRVEGPPNASFSSAAGRFAEARRASARDGALKNAQVQGRASGVCCERGWAAGWAAGRRAGAHRPCGRGRGDTGRRTESCPPRPTRPTAPAQRSVHVRPTLRRRDPAPTRQPWRRTTCPTTRYIGT